jgi:hypothetical protein
MRGGGSEIEIADYLLLARKIAKISLELCNSAGTLQINCFL